ncbi:hypothetical protein EV401DRAFT_1799082, partial [Pisolithus croceorrhizus]
NHQHIPEAVKQQWVTMLTLMSSQEIAQATGTSHRTVNQVLQLSRLTGSVVKKPCTASRHPCTLTAHDVQVRSSVHVGILHSPDIYLSKLQYHLEKTRGVHVSMCTIQCTLWQHGFTHKHV